ncbi:MAG: protein TolR [Steroidobacteraceae bacterium]|nr:protein TolR [Nevskiaceae bacterium]MCP5359755.1 protein TolR [Nevskiaceae bacterium]MCP5472755.1 protein TolR [Nevskiaceae bacterium]
MAQVNRGRRAMADINVVPYIDVMLVLLVIFMVTAPLLTQGIKVDLPKAAAEPIDLRDLKDRKPLVLSIDRTGRLFLNEGDDPESPLDAATAQARVTAILRLAPDLPVLVKGDREVPYGKVVEAMVMLQGAGAARLGFITDPLPAAAAPRRR